MRKVFIDCGAYDGCSIKLFREKCDPNYEYEIFSFEPPPPDPHRDILGCPCDDPDCILRAPPQVDLKSESLEKAAKDYQAKIIRKAVWVCDSEILFYGDLDAGSTAIGERMFTNGDPVSKTRQDTAYMVECIDLSKWIRKTFDKEDHIELKMDIEGAEYEVIKRMHKDGTLGMINKFSGELHGTKVRKTRAETDKLLEYCSDYGLKMYIWDAINSADVGSKYYNRETLDNEFDKWEKRFDKSAWGNLDR